MKRLAVQVGWLLMLMLMQGLYAENIPVSTGGIPADVRPRYTMHEPYRGAGEPPAVRAYWRHGDVSHYFAPDYLRQAGLRIREVSMTPQEHEALRGLDSLPLTTAEGIYQSRWNHFMLDTLAAPEEILWVTYTGPMPYGRKRSIEALAPQLSPAEIAFEKTGWREWLLPIPEGYREKEGARAGKVRLIMPWGWPVDADRRAQRLQVSGPNDEMLGEIVFWFEQPLTFDRALRNALAFHGQMKPVREYGHHLLRLNTGTREDQRLPRYAWQSGQYLVHLQPHRKVADQTLRQYLVKYPPTWDADFAWDPTAQALGWVDEAMILLRQGLDDPPEFLRYPYTWYPFEQGRFLARQALPNSHEWDSPYQDGVNKAHATWSTSTDGTEPDIAEYVDRIRALREACIGQVEAARARIVQHGIVYSGPGRYKSFGDDPR